jgi:hypothetical protein
LDAGLRLNDEKLIVGVVRMFPIEWKIAGASVAGFSHQETGAACQDSHATATLDNTWLVAAISDGAGSATRSAEGAHTVCHGIVRYIAAHLPQISQDEHQLNPTAAHLVVAAGVELIRLALANTANGDPLDFFHATLVGVIAGANGGVFFHIGDGAACAMEAESFSSCIISHPENGEYANETFFFTQPNWRDHLRITPFSAEFNLIALMSDGVTPFALVPH